MVHRLGMMNIHLFAESSLELNVFYILFIYNRNSLVHNRKEHSKQQFSSIQGDS